MNTLHRILCVSAALSLSSLFTGCNKQPVAPGPGARSENINATDARTQDGSNAAGQTTPGNRGGTPGGAAPGSSPN